MLTNELLDKTKEKIGARKEIELANKLGVTKTRLNNYRSGLCKPDAEACFLIAEIIEEEPAAVIAAIRLDASKEPEKVAFWREKAKKYAASAGIISALLAGSPAQAEEGNAVNNNMHYAHNYKHSMPTKLTLSSLFSIHRHNNTTI